MLICWRPRRTAVVVPLFVLACAAIAAAGAIGLARTPRPGGAVVLALLDVGIWLMAIHACLRLEADDVALRVRGLWRHDRLDVRRCAFGVHREGYGKSTEFTVFVTDGLRHVDVTNCASQAGAAEAVRRFSRTLLREPGEVGLREVERIEKRWRASEAEATHLVATYYASADWRRAKWLVLGFAALSVGLALAFYWLNAR